MKGRSRKELVRADGEYERTEVHIEVLRTSVVVLDLAFCTVEVVEQSGGAGPAHRPEAKSA